MLCQIYRNANLCTAYILIHDASHTWDSTFTISLPHPTINPFLAMKIHHLCFDRPNFMAYPSHCICSIIEYKSFQIVNEIAIY